MVVIWQLSIVTGLIRFRYFPTPVSVAEALQTLISSGALLENTAHTVLVALLAWVIAGVLGICLGLVIGLSVPIWKGIMASVDVLRSLPIIALIPVGVIIFGFTLKLEIVIATYAAIWPIIVNTVSGVHQTRTELLDVGNMLRMSRWERMRKLIFPSSLPLILVGLRLGLGLSLVLTVVSEIVGTPQGIGYALISAEQALHPSEMFAYIVTVGIVGYLLNSIFLYSAQALSPVERSRESNPS
ncbi:MAG: ABC transporter permease [Acidimicrobiaceae bacterium]|nr:ABC transporter permease [Acidimicrobiaceae bacterium]